MRHDAAFGVGLKSIAILANVREGRRVPARSAGRPALVEMRGSFPRMLDAPSQPARGIAEDARSEPLRLGPPPTHTTRNVLQRGADIVPVPNTQRDGPLRGE